jgi:membrane fusion protein (multidrug efflux system)
VRAYLFVIALLVLIFGGIGGYLYNKFSSLAAMDFTPPPATIAAGVAVSETWPSSLAAVGTIQAVRGVELATEASGEVIEITVASGDQVTAGQLLLTLNDSVEQASKERQEANLELARLLFERDASLVKQKSIPQSQYDRSRADLDSATAQLAETEARLDNKRVIAPFSGTVGIIRAKVGDYIESGDSITTLQDLSALEVDFSVPARHAPRLRPGLAVKVTTTAFPDREFIARLQALDAKVDASTRNLSLRAQLEQSDGLLPGMFARLSIDLDRPREVVAVPETAVSYSLQGNTVFVISEDDEGLLVEPRVVTTGPARGGRIAILSGLEAGDRVVIAGQNKLYRGARVTIDDSVDM